MHSRNVPRIRHDREYRFQFQFEHLTAVALVANYFRPFMYVVSQCSSAAAPATPRFPLLSDSSRCRPPICDRRFLICIGSPRPLALQNLDPVLGAHRTADGSKHRHHDRGMSHWPNHYVAGEERK